MDVFGAILNEIDEKYTQLRDYLAAGRAQKYEEYASICGEIKALVHLKSYIKELKSNTENSDNE